MVKCYFCKNDDAVAYVQAHHACCNCYIMRRQGKRGLRIKKLLCENNSTYRREMLIQNGKT